MPDEPEGRLTRATSWWSRTPAGRPLEAGVEVCRSCIAAGADARASRRRARTTCIVAPELTATSPCSATTSRANDLELVIVLGGDGTILRAAELVRGCDAPLLGVNLGHVGFLAESERDDLRRRVARALARDYAVEERMTLSVRVKVGDEVVYETWALNEATVEKAERERMLEVVIEVDGRPLSTFGCDGVVMSTPTGSTAYSFSAGGPGGLAERRGAALVPLSRARAVRAAARGRARLVARGRDARAHRRRRRALVRRPPHVRPAAAARASSCAGRRSRCGSPGCTRRRSPTGSCNKFRCPSPDGGVRPCEGVASA